MVYDSDYKLPNDNYRVVSDFDPVKMAALDEARRRY